MPAPTIRDVAKRAGVGVGTVSRVLNGSPQVRDETRRKVLAAIRALGFSPNSAARQLSRGKTSTIGILAPFFTFPSFVERLTGIQSVLDQSDYDLILYSVRAPDQVLQQISTIVGQNRVDGLIVLSLPFAEEEIRLIRPDFPVVVVDNERVQHYPHIVIDNVEGGRMATNFLIERGHRDIAFVSDRLENPFGFTSSQRRFEGFQQAMQAAGLEIHDAWCRFVEHSQRAARDNARDILSQERRPTAIFAAMDTLALGVLSAIYDLGLRVPDDVAVIGFDDIEAAGYMNLTTVRQQLFESGRWSAQQMLAWLDNGESNLRNVQIKLPLEIVVRATV